MTWEPVLVTRLEPGKRIHICGEDLVVEGVVDLHTGLIKLVYGRYSNGVEKNTYIWHKLRVWTWFDAT